MPTKYINSTAESDDIHEQLFAEKKQYKYTTFLTTYFISI